MTLFDPPGFRAVLTYHSVDESGSVISITPDAFAAHVRYLAASGVRVLSLVDLVRESCDEARPGGDAVALTFDDGFANFGVHAAPILLDRGMTATLFVVSRHVGRTNAWRGNPAPSIPTLPLLGWDALGRLHDAGFEIGAHTRTHPALDARAAALEDEIEGSSEDIVRALGCRPSSFAYPYGGGSGPATALARSVYDLAVSTDFRGLASGDDRARLPRLDAYYFRSPDGLGGWGGARFRASVSMRGALRTMRSQVRRTRRAPLEWRAP